MHGVKLIAVVLLMFAAARGMTQEHQHAIGEKLGDGHFAASCSEMAQGDFNRAVALLHSFQFSHTIEGFDAVPPRYLLPIPRYSGGRPARPGMTPAPSRP